MNSPIAWNEIAPKSNGGTELMGRRLEASLKDNAFICENYQIILSRVRELDETKLRVLWCHDLPDDPESKHLENGGWRKFHRIVFVSHWQQQHYINRYQIPWSKTCVLQNAIEQFEPKIKKPRKGINLIYHSTPHRGLEILVPVFAKLRENHKDITLDVYSSFGVYGWEQRDEPYQKVFDRITEIEGATYHKFQPNDAVRDALKRAHIFAYPCIWPETACLALMEAMAAGCVCVHPNYGALHETASNMTAMYNFHEVPNSHAGTFYHMLDAVINALKNKDVDLQMRLTSQKAFADVMYNWEVRARQWENFLMSFKDEPRGIEQPKEVFTYRST
jgi:UDP-glucose:(glucosyl)LPS alpha-1,2-glucosyltransferase